jgi:serine/threonine protein kinase
MKFLPDELVRDAGALERFRREAKANAALNHTNICTIQDINENEDRPFVQARRKFTTLSGLRGGAQRARATIKFPQ